VQPKSLTNTEAKELIQTKLQKEGLRVDAKPIIEGHFYRVNLWKAFPPAEGRVTTYHKIVESHFVEIAGNHSDIIIHPNTKMSERN
jgi:hypothetical protein